MIMHIQPEGFRFPYQDWDTDEAVEKNMKYLEFQLEKFLHWHHVNEAPPEEL